jgi:hypothetical protein
MDTYYEFIRAFVESKEKKVKIIKEDTRKNKDYELILEI